MTVEKIWESQPDLGSIYALESIAGINVIGGGSGKAIMGYQLPDMARVALQLSVPNTIYSILYIPAKNWLCIGTANGYIHVIDLEFGKELKCFRYHSKEVFDLKTDEWGTFLFSSGADGVLNKFNLENLQHVIQIRLSNLKLRRMSMAGDVLLVPDGEGRVHQVNIHSFEPYSPFQVSSQSCNVCLWLSDENYLLCGSKDAHLYLVDLNSSSKIIHVVPAHNFAIYDLVMVSNGTRIASASRDKTIKLWSRDEILFLLRISDEQHGGHRQSVNALKCIGDNLFSTGDDRVIKKWRISDY